MVNTRTIALQWQILTVGAAYMTIDNVAHRGPNREPCSQSHHFARAQGALVTLLHYVHDAPCTQRDAPPKHRHDACHLHLTVLGLTVFNCPASCCTLSFYVLSCWTTPVYEMSSQQIRLPLLLLQIKWCSLQSECISWCHVQSCVFCCQSCSTKLKA